MFNSPENAIVRIDIDIDYSSLNDDEVELLDKLIELGDSQLNAPCNNRLARIAELNREMRSLSPDEIDRKLEITNEIREMQTDISEDKRRGYFQDYGILKRRIAHGATASEVYSMMPYFYAVAYNRHRQFSKRNKDDDKDSSSRFIEEAPQWLNFLKSLSDFIRTFGGSA